MMVTTMRAIDHATVNTGILTRRQSSLANQQRGQLRERRVFAIPLSCTFKNLICGLRVVGESTDFLMIHDGLVPVTDADLPA